jgi:hypothetical protein
MLKQQVISSDSLFGPKRSNAILYLCMHTQIRGIQNHCQSDRIKYEGITDRGIIAEMLRF